MTRIAVAYQSLEGQTERIARHIAQIAQSEQAAVDVFAVEDAPASLAAYDAVAVGGSVHKGSHHKDLARFVMRHKDDLAARPGAFFSVSLTVVDPAEESQEAIRKIAGDFLETTGWQPEIVALFGGALSYTRYGFFIRKIMKQVARHYGGPTDTTRDHDLTDWEAVDHFARELVALARATAPVA